MKLDPNNYRKTLDALKERIIEQKEKLDYLSELSVHSHIPLLAVILFSMRVDVIGPTTELEVFQDRITKFYGYEHVSPWSDLDILNSEFPDSES